jgi:uncharacterized protein YqeY
MALFEQISKDIMQSMRDRDKVRTEALRGIKKEFIEAKTAKGSNGELTDDTALKIMQKMVKQRKESADIYTQQNRPDLAEGELAEIKVIETYLPKQMSDAELTEAIKAIIAQTGVTSIKEMGKVMGLASKQLAGKAEGKAISDKVKALLN